MRPHFRILYAASMRHGSTSMHRLWALRRLGHEVVEFNMVPYFDTGSWLFDRIRIRTQIGPTISRLNADLLALARRARPDLAWFDRATFVRARTVRALSESGVFTVHFNPDNPFARSVHPGWRLLLDAIPAYDLHAVKQASSLAEYQRAGARDTVLMPLGYEPSIHYPPPTDWSESDRTNDVAFIGSPYDDRPAFLAALWRDEKIPVKIWGAARWRSFLPQDAAASLVQGSEVWNDDYRETMWRSRILLSFVTHCVHDEVAHKSFEIAGSGGFLLAEDTPGHRACFVDGEEAVFFRSVEDCAEKIRRYLPDAAARARIAAAGRRRAVASGYGNDARIARVLAHVREKMGVAA